MSVRRMFSRRVRGFRIIEVAGLALLIATVLTVYLGKTLAGKERNQITEVEKQIAQEQDRVRMLKAEVAYLEQPARLERLSSEVLRLAPIEPKHETTLEGLAALANTPAQPAAAAPVMAAEATTPVAEKVAAEKGAAAKPAVPPGAAAAKGGLTP